MMVEVRYIVSKGGWVTATLASAPMIAGYGRTDVDALAALKREIAARAERLEQEAAELRAMFGLDEGAA